MKKSLFICGVLALAISALVSCSPKNDPEDMTNDPEDMTFEDIVSADVHSIIDTISDPTITHRFFETRILFNEYLDETPTPSIFGIQTIVEYSAYLKGFAGCYRITRENGKRTVEFAKGTFMGDDGIDITRPITLQKALELMNDYVVKNEIQMPHTKHCVLRAPSYHKYAGTYFIVYDKDTKTILEVNTTSGMVHCFTDGEDGYNYSEASMAE